VRSRSWLALAVLGLAAIAPGGPAVGQSPPPPAPPDADMLLDLDLLKDADLAKDRDLLERMPLIERLRMLENLRLLESQVPTVPAVPAGGEARPQ
jgi:hypothetical protein